MPLVILLLCIAFAFAFDRQDYFSLESIQAQKEDLQTYIKDYPVWSAVSFTLIYTLCVALSLPIATILTLLGGFLFGLLKGTLLVVTGATAGATIIFIIARTSLGMTLREKAGGLYQKVEKNMKKNMVSYLLFMRLVPIFPFVLVNILPALFNISIKVFVLTTFIGILPGSAVYVYFGQQFGSINSLSDLANAEVLLAFTLLGLFALIPTIYNKKP